jgi:hypothetical protein
MSQNDFVISDATFPQVLADLSSAFAAAASNSSGAGAPATTYPFQFWADEATNTLKMRNRANNNWLTLANINTSTNRWEVRADVFQALTTAGISLRNAAGVQRVGISDAGVLTLIANAIDGAAVKNFSSLLSGAVPASGGGTANYLRADGSWAEPVAKATWGESEGGTLNDKYMTPQGTRRAVATALGAVPGSPIFAVRAWGNFSGFLPSVRAAGNLSITRTATGEFAFTFTTAMPDEKYAVTITTSAEIGIVIFAVGAFTSGGFAASFRRADTGAAVNPDIICLEVTR